VKFDPEFGSLIDYFKIHVNLALGWLISTYVQCIYSRFGLITNLAPPPQIYLRFGAS
jgi:hypothetical protein